MAHENIYVLQLGNGWVVKYENSKEFELISQDKKSAIEFAKQLVRKEKANLIIQDKEENFQEQALYQWEEYINKKIGFSIIYRNDFIINDSYVYAALGPGRNIPGISFGLPYSFIDGTNLSSDSYISIEWLFEKESSSTRSFINETYIKEEKLVYINHEQFSLLRTEEWGMGNIYEETLLVHNINNYFIGIRLFLHSHNIKAYDPGIVKLFDIKNIMSIYEKMVKNLRPVSGFLIADG